MSKKQQLILTLFVFCLIIVFALYYVKQLKSGLDEASAPPQNLYSSGIEKGPVVVINEVQCDFEKNESGELSDKQSSSGKFSQHYSDKVEYGYTFSKKLIEFEPKGRVKKINYRFKLFGTSLPKDVVVVCSTEDEKGKTDVWLSSAVDFKTSVFEPNAWNNVSALFDIDFGKYDPQHQLKLYIWNRSKSEFYVDDVVIEFSGYSSNPELNQDETFVINKNLQQNFELDFESDSGLVNTGSISNENPRHGKRCVKLSASNEYGAGIGKKVSEVTEDSLKDIFIRAWIFPKKENVNVVLVASITSPDGKTKAWQGKGTENYTFKKNQWNLVNAWMQVGDANAQPEDVVTAYVWNKGKDEVYVDDMLIVCGRYDDHAGTKSNIDMRPTSEAGYTPERNNPPYDISYLEKQKINFNDGKFLNSQSQSELFPDATFLVGDFLKTDYTSKTEEFIQVHNNTMQLFSFCEKENAFILKHNSSNESFNTEMNFVLSGNFYGKANSEHGQLISVNKSTSEFNLSEFMNQENCSQTIAELKNVAHGNLNFKLTGQEKLVAYDIEYDGQDELMIVSATAISCYTFDFKSNSFHLKSTYNLKDSRVNLGNNDKLKISVLKYGLKSGLLLINEKAKKFLLCDAGKKSFTAFDDSFDLKIAQTGDTYYQLNNQFIKINTAFRNELQYAVFDSKGLTIEKNIDFTGYEKDFNPLYYEMCKIIPGKFLNANSTSMIVIQKNCADKNFDGINCKQYEELNDLPNKVEVYQQPAPLPPKGK